MPRRPTARLYKPRKLSQTATHGIRRSSTSPPRKKRPNRHVTVSSPRSVSPQSPTLASPRDATANSLAASGGTTPPRSPAAGTSPQRQYSPAAESLDPVHRPSTALGGDRRGGSSPAPAGGDITHPNSAQSAFRPRSESWKDSHKINTLRSPLHYPSHPISSIRKRNLSTRDLRRKSQMPDNHGQISRRNDEEALAAAAAAQRAEEEWQHYATLYPSISGYNLDKPTDIQRLPETLLRTLSTAQRAEMQARLDTEEAFVSLCRGDDPQPTIADDSAMSPPQGESPATIALPPGAAPPETITLPVHPPPERQPAAGESQQLQSASQQLMSTVPPTTVPDQSTAAFATMPKSPERAISKEPAAPEEEPALTYDKLDRQCREFDLKLDTTELEAMDTDGDGTIDREEFQSLFPRRDLGPMGPSRSASPHQSQSDTPAVSRPGSAAQMKPHQQQQQQPVEEQVQGDDRHNRPSSASQRPLGPTAGVRQPFSHEVPYDDEDLMAFSAGASFRITDEERTEVAVRVLGDQAAMRASAKRMHPDIDIDAAVPDQSVALPFSTSENFDQNHQGLSLGYDGPMDIGSGSVGAALFATSGTNVLGRSQHRGAKTAKVVVAEPRGGQRSKGAPAGAGGRQEAAESPKRGRWRRKGPLESQGKRPEKKPALDQGYRKAGNDEAEQDDEDDWVAPPGEVFVAKVEAKILHDRLRGPQSGASTGTDASVPAGFGGRRGHAVRCGSINSYQHPDAAKRQQQQGRVLAEYARLPPGVIPKDRLASLVAGASVGASSTGPSGGSGSHRGSSASTGIGSDERGSVASLGYDRRSTVGGGLSRHGSTGSQQLTARDGRTSSSGSLLDGDSARGGSTLARKTSATPGSLAPTLSPGATPGWSGSVPPAVTSPSLGYATSSAGRRSPETSPMMRGDTSTDVAERLNSSHEVPASVQLLHLREHLNTLVDEQRKDQRRHAAGKPPPKR